MATTLVMTLLVRDEEDVLEANLRHHLDQGVDLVLAMDNGSRDATPEILRAFEVQGVLRRVECPLPEEFRQAEWVTLMARLAAKEHAADWVINADADEFWWPLAGTLADVIGAVPPECEVLEVPRSDFLPGSDGDGSFHQRLVLRETATVSPTGWPLLPKVAHRAHPKVEVTSGNHSVAGPWTRVLSAGGLIEVLHFPMRDYAQFERKVINTGEALARTPSVPSDAAMDQRTLFALHAEGRLRDYYEERLPSAAAIAAGLADGTLVEDRRLADFLADGAGRRRGPRPEARAIGEVAAAALGFAAARMQLASVSSRLAAAEEQLAQAGADIAELDRRLTETREDLRRESQALATLRASKVVRWSRAPRRLYYRAQRRLRGQDSPSSQ